MKNVPIIILSTFMLSNVAWGKPVIQPTTNSLSKATLEINAMNAQPHPQKYTKVSSVNTHENEKDNSLSHAVLAIQEANMKVDSTNVVNYSQNTWSVQFILRCCIGKAI
jgi:anion-transporting  ArsA/GET3 family ATPase